jgi:hypothetical protein
MSGLFDTVRALGRGETRLKLVALQSNGPAARELAFERGYPAEDAIARGYDATDMERAVAAYRFFYPTVCGAALFKGSAKVGLVSNKVFGTLDMRPRHLAFTASSDMPCALLPLDLKRGPLVVDVPPGPLMIFAADINQRWVADMGLTGPEEGHGARHVLVPPGYDQKLPPGLFVWSPTSNRTLVNVRSIPLGGDVQGAIERLRTIAVRPLETPAGYTEPTWIDLTPAALDTTPLAWEDGLQYWRELHEIVDTEPPYVGYRNNYGELAALGIVKGRPFSPDERMRRILERASRTANSRMRVQSLCDRRPDRLVFRDRRWEWVSLRFEDGDFDTLTATDLEAREKWFYQATGASPLMFRRTTSAGIVTWLGARDESGAQLDGGKTYELVIPQPVPARLFWSVTVYDPETRSQIRTSQGKAAIRSMFELRNKLSGKTLSLYFGPAAPVGKEVQWIKTVPGKGWFAHFRIYGPQPSAFDGSFKPSDFRELRYGQ